MPKADPSCRNCKGRGTTDSFDGGRDRVVHHRCGCTFVCHDCGGAGQIARVENDPPGLCYRCGGTGHQGYRERVNMAQPAASEVPAPSLPTYHGTCPYCASAVSCVTRDEMTYARCSHRGCGARGPYHRDLMRAVEWFTGKPHPSRAASEPGRCLCSRRLGDYCPTPDDDCPLHGTDRKEQQPAPRRCEACEGTGFRRVNDPNDSAICHACNGTGRKGER